jgi:hypothetical protein
LGAAEQPKQHGQTARTDLAFAAQPGVEAIGRRQQAFAQAFGQGGGARRLGGQPRHAPAQRQQSRHGGHQDQQGADAQGQGIEAQRGQGERLLGRGIARSPHHRQSRRDRRAHIRILPDTAPKCRWRAQKTRGGCPFAFRLLNLADS